MSVESGQAITVDFGTQSPTTGAATDATGTPTGTVVVNGTDNAASVTVTNKGTGYYKAAVTLPSLSAGDRVQLRIAATVSGVAGVGYVWGDYCEARQTGDSFARIGAAGAGLTAVGLADGAITAAKIAADAITDAKVSADVTIASVTGAVGSVTGAVGSVTGAVGSVTGNVGGSVASVATGGITAGSFAAGAIDAAAIATDAIGSAELAASAVTEIQAGLSTLDAAGVRTAVGLASANLDTQLDTLPTATENAAAVWTVGNLTVAAVNRIADVILRRTTANVEASSYGDTLAGRSLYGAVARLAHKVATSLGTMTVYKSDDSTSLTTATLTTDSAADPVVTVDPAA